MNRGRHYPIYSGGETSQCREPPVGGAIHNSIELRILSTCMQTGIDPSDNVVRVLHDLRARSSISSFSTRGRGR